VPAVVTVALGDTVTGPQRDAVTATPEHPLFVLGRGWMGIERLTVGDALATRAGPPLVVQSVTRKHRAEGYLVYNLTVEGDHTYFVGKVNGGIWAHNTLPCRPFADDQALNENMIEQMYRGEMKEGQWTSADEYPGGLAGAVRREVATGEKVGGKSHFDKGYDRLAGLKNILTIYFKSDGFCESLFQRLNQSIAVASLTIAK